MADFMYREYSSAQQGRWLSPDPAGLAAVDVSNPQSWNRYAYAMNTPLNVTDPLGLDPGMDLDTYWFWDLFGRGGGSYSPTCLLDGVEIGCDLAARLNDAGATAFCPQCRPGDRVGADNHIYRISPETGLEVRLGTVWIPFFIRYPDFVGAQRDAGGNGESAILPTPNQVFGGCLTEARQENQQKVKEFVANLDKRVLWSMAKGAGLGAIRGARSAAIITAETGQEEVVVPAGAAGAVVGAVFGAGGGVFTSVAAEPLNRILYAKYLETKGQASCVLSTVGYYTTIR